MKPEPQGVDLASEAISLLAMSAGSWSSACGVLDTWQDERLLNEGRQRYRDSPLSREATIPKQRRHSRPDREHVVLFDEGRPRGSPTFTCPGRLVITWVRG